MFTFILDLDGGTYLHQICAEGLQEAVGSYIKLLSSGYPEGYVRFGRFLASSWEGDAATEVAGLRDVWCFSASDNEYHAIVHIVGQVRAAEVTS